jgi:UDP-N-acetyl-D-mannosaminuronic acid transferase (WecB/TagA/CpsF family)
MKARSDDSTKFRQILGIKFFVGTAKESIEQIRSGGLLVVPAAPALKDLPTAPAYREALLGSDFAIADSIFMVLLWNLITRDSVRRLSGLEYLRELLLDPEVRESRNTFWVMASPKSAALNVKWLREQGIAVGDEDVYLAPMYPSEISDPALLDRLNARPYRHVIITVGGGTQERLGLYLKQNLKFLPAIHCIGAAIAFLSGDQVRIPTRADALGLGWLFRCISKPEVYLPRYWSARKLAWLMIRYKQNMPPLESKLPA